MLTRFHIYTLSMCVGACLLSACDDHIDEFEIPKRQAQAESSATTAPQSRTLVDTLNLRNDVADAASLQWTDPAEWKSVEASGMRIKSYQIPDNGDVSVIRLGAGAGGVLGNINRWRSQVGLDMVSEAQLADVTERLSAPAGTFLATTLVNPDDPEKAICAVMFFADSFTLFVKLTASRACIEKNASAVYAYCRAVTNTEVPAPTAQRTSPGTSTGAAVLPPTNTLMRAGAIIWKAPATWTEKKASGMRIKSYTTPHNGDLSVIRMAAGAGGVLGNINRWRGQVGLDPIALVQVAETTTTIDTPAGTFIALTLVNPDNSQQAICGAMFFAETFTLFVKLSGTQACIEAQSAAVYDFCKQVTVEK